MVLDPKILFITSNSIGDAVLSTGLLDHLIHQYPTARFTVVCGPAPAPLFRAIPRLDQLIIMKKRSWKRHWLSMWYRCLPVHWDLVVDLRNSVFSRLLMRRKLTLMSKSSNRHKILDLASTLNLTPPPAPHIWIDEKAESLATQLLKIANAHPILALGPAANWPPKQWPIEKFITLAHHLTEPGHFFSDGFILIAAAPHELDLVEPLLRAFPAEKIINCIGYDLLTVAACLKQCRIYIGNDSGLMHLAAATGVPTLGLFGPGYEHIYGPWGKNGYVVRTPENREDLLARLENGSAPNLMESLSVEDVIKSVARIVSIDASQCSASHKGGSNQ